MRAAVKAVMKTIALLLTGPLALVERLARLLVGKDVLFAGQAELLSLVPGKTGSYLRNAYYWLTLKECSMDARFLLGAMFTHSEAEVGRRVYVGAHCILGMVRIGDDTLLADHVQVLSGKNQHSFDDPKIPIQQQPQKFEQVKIGKNVWVGTCAVIMADVGDDSVIGAGSIVTRPIPAGMIAVGSPAKVIRRRTQAEVSNGQAG